jgi:hypothetical protein
MTTRTRERLTRQMNAAFAEIGDTSLEVTQSAAGRILERSDW